MTISRASVASQTVAWRRDQLAVHGELFCRLAASNRGGELLEKIVGHLLGGAVDQPLAELRELAANLCVDIVGEQRAAILVGELHVGASLGESSDTALSLAHDLVAVRRIEIGQ